MQKKWPPRARPWWSGLCLRAQTPGDSRGHLVLPPSQTLHHSHTPGGATWQGALARACPDSKEAIAGRDPAFCHSSQSAYPFLGWVSHADPQGASEQASDSPCQAFHQVASPPRGPALTLPLSAPGPRAVTALITMTETVIDNYLKLRERSHVPKVTEKRASEQESEPSPACPCACQIRVERGEDGLVLLRTYWALKQSHVPCFT